MSYTTVKKRTAIQKLFEKSEWGSYLGEIPEQVEKNSNLCLFGDGQWILRKNQIGIFCRKYKPDGIPGLEDGPEPFFKFGLPKIPLNILKQQVSFYRAVMREHRNAEAYSIVMYDKTEERYFLVVPKQRVSGAAVSYAQDDLRKDYPSDRYIEVISGHSHNSMGAFFSGTDDADEKADMIYMVMGKLDQPSPKFRIRANVAGSQALFLELDEIFETDEEEWTLLSPGWTEGHDPEWMKMLNVVADYRSALHTRTSSQRTIGFTRGYKNLANRRASTTKTYQGFQGNSYHPDQTSFDEYFEFFNSLDDYEDTDAKAIQLIAKELYQDAVSRAPEFALAGALDALVSLGYGEQIYEAVRMSSAAEILWDMSDAYTKRLVEKRVEDIEEEEEESFVGDFIFGKGERLIDDEDEEE